MELPDSVVLDPVEESCILQAWWRAEESARACPLIVDEFAVALCSDLVGAELARRFRSSGADRLGREIHIQSAAAADRRLVEWDATAVNPQIVNLGAGLDMRPLRLRWSQKPSFFHVDRPAVLALAARHLNDVAGVRLVAGSAAEPNALFESLVGAGADLSAPIAWIMEGLTEFLGEGRSAALAEQMVHASAPGSMIVIQALDPAFIRSATRLGGVSWRRLPEPAAIANSLAPWPVDDLSREFTPRQPDVRDLVHVYVARNEILESSDFAELRR